LIAIKHTRINLLYLARETLNLASN